MEYQALVTQEHGWWRGYLPDLELRVSGKNEQDVILKLEVAAGEHITQLMAQGNEPPEPKELEKDDLTEDEFPLQDVWHLYGIVPRIPNPVSLTIKQAIHRSGKTATEIAKLLETSPAAITRMTDPSYDGHSLHSLRKLADALKVPLQRFVGLKGFALGNFVSVSQSGMYAPGYVALKRTAELAQLELPALVRWEGSLFWLDAPAGPPHVTSDKKYLRFEGAQVENVGFSLGILS